MKNTPRILTLLLLVLVFIVPLSAHQPVHAKHGMVVAMEATAVDAGRGASSVAANPVSAPACGCDISSGGTNASHCDRVW